MGIVSFRNRQELGSAFRRSLDLNDLAAALTRCANTMNTAALAVDRAHFIPETSSEAGKQMASARQAAADVVAALDEYEASTDIMSLTDGG